jgi:predicted MFS family arabinose efflux permease
MRLAPGRLAWLLALALLLPLTQTVASAHLLSHVNAQPTGEADGKSALHAEHCDLCLTAGAVLGGALPTHSLSPTPILLSLAVPAAQAGSVWLAPPPQPYQSRAPPFFRY